MANLNHRSYVAFHHGRVDAEFWMEFPDLGRPKNPYRDDRLRASWNKGFGQEEYIDAEEPDHRSMAAMTNEEFMAYWQTYCAMVEAAGASEAEVDEAFEEWDRAWLARHAAYVAKG